MVLHALQPLQLDQRAQEGAGPEILGRGVGVVRGRGPRRASTRERQHAGRQPAGAARSHVENTTTSWMHDENTEDQGDPRGSYAAPVGPVKHGYVEHAPAIL